MSKRRHQWPKTCSDECKDIKEKRRRKARYDADPGGAKRNAREWRLANQERKRERARRYREANKDVIREKKRAYVLANFEKDAARKRAWHQENRDRIRAEWLSRQTSETRAEAARRTRAWVALNGERKKETRRSYYISNRERVLVGIARRRATKLSAPADGVALSVLLADQESICYLCGERIDSTVAHPAPMSASIDHVIPLARGGTGLRENLRAAHLFCNLSKGTKLLEELRFAVTG